MWYTTRLGLSVRSKQTFRKIPAFHSKVGSTEVTDEGLRSSRSIHRPYVKSGGRHGVVAWKRSAPSACRTLRNS
jgi:hypothetical protein